MKNKILLIIYSLLIANFSNGQEIKWDSTSTPLIVEFEDNSKNHLMYMVFFKHKDSIAQILFVEEKINDDFKNINVIPFENYIKSLSLSDSLHFAFIVKKDQKYYSSYDGSKKNYTHKDKITIIRNDADNVSKDLFFNKEVFLFNTLYSYSRYYFLN